MKVAIVCDWLVGTGGAERVVLELHKMFPDAPIYTSQYNRDSRAWYNDDWFKDADVRTGSLQKLPLGLRKFLPVFRAWYFSHLDLSGYDLVISSSGAEAKAVKTGPRSIHVCYMHAPTHYYWSRYDEYMAYPGFGRFDPLARLGLKFLAGPMRHWDRRAAQKPDYLLANSGHTKEQIKKYYGREAVVIHPPVDIERFVLKSEKKRRGFLIAGRQTPYKRFDLAVQACTRANMPLSVIGNGPDHLRLQKLAGPTVTFLTGLSDKEVVEHFHSAEAFIFPGIDDFGVVAVEALAAGTPVIAYHGGGAIDYIKDGKNGTFFEKQTVESLKAALGKFDPGAYDSRAVAASAKVFSPQNFDSKLKAFIAAKAKGQTA